MLRIVLALPLSLADHGVNVVGAHVGYQILGVENRDSGAVIMLADYPDAAPLRLRFDAVIEGYEVDDGPSYVGTVSLMVPGTAERSPAQIWFFGEL